MADQLFFIMLLVPGAGIEPAWTEARWILSPVRLPISPPRLLKPKNIMNTIAIVKQKLGWDM